MIQFAVFEGLSVLIIFLKQPPKISRKYKIFFLILIPMFVTADCDYRVAAFIYKKTQQSPKKKRNNDEN